MLHHIVLGSFARRMCGVALCALPGWGTKMRQPHVLRTKLMFSAILAASLTVGVPPFMGDATAATVAKPTEHILVMGDSYSAGNGAGSYIAGSPKTCYRSSKNYGQVFATTIQKPPYNQPAVVTNVACSGAVSADITTVSQYPNVAKQISSVTTSYDTIFLTIGGNDVDFGDIVKNCLISKTNDGTKCNTFLGGAENLIANGTIATRIKGVLAAIRTKDIGAEIVLLGYPFLEGSSTYTLTAGNGVVVQVGKRLHALQVAANTLEQSVVTGLNSVNSGTPFVFVSVQQLFNGPPFHGLYAAKVNPNRWMVQPSVDVPLYPCDTCYHPNTTGWAKEGALLASSATVPKSTKPLIATAKLPGGTVGDPYSTDLTTNDHRTGSWTIAAGRLPSGLTLSGYTISGIPTVFGADSFTLQFVDSDGRVATAIGSLVVSAFVSAPTITDSTFTDQGISLSYTPPTGVSSADLVDYICRASPDGGTTVYPCDSSDGYPSGVGTSNPATASNLIYYDPGYYQIVPGWSISMAAVTAGGPQSFGPWYTIASNPLGAPTITGAVVGTGSLSISFNPSPTVPGLTVQQYICEVSPDGGTTVYTCNGGVDGTLGSMGLTSPAAVPSTIYYDPGYYQITPGWSIRMWAVAATISSPRSAWVTIS